MEKRRFRIESNLQVADRTWRILLAALEPGYEFSGEFVDVAIDGFYLRRPLSVCDYAPGRITLLYRTVGAGTEALAAMQPGGELELLTGLGRGFDASRCVRSALLAGGGLGAAPLLPLAGELKAQGKEVTVVLGFNKASETVLKEEFTKVCDRLEIATLDGSEGTRGFVTDAIKAIGGDYDYFYACGPTVMMKAVCELIPLQGEVSLEERMGCGSGFCYGCSINTVSGARRVCADGPVFRKEELLW